MAGEKERLHWMPVHVNDLTSDEKVLAMTTEEFGAYFKLLCASWKSDPPCTIPDDDDTLARLCGLSRAAWKKAKARVLSPWKSNGDGRLLQKRQLEVHADVIAKIEQKREAGKRGGKAKAAKNTDHANTDTSSGARAVLGQRQDFASSEHGSETVTGTLAKPSNPLTINQSVSSNKETQPPPSPKGGGVRKPSGGVSVTIPECLQTSEFESAWAKWKIFRKEIKKPITQTQAETMIECFAEWGASRSVAAIRYTITKGWQGLAEPDGVEHSKHEEPAYPSPGDPTLKNWNRQ